MVAPFLLIFFTFTVWPVIFSFVISFTNYNILEFPKWIGWDNYVNLFVNDDVFIIALKNTFLFALITGPLSYLLSLVFAWIINDMTPFFRTFMTVVFYAPSIAGSVFTIWILIFDGDIYGTLNSMLINFNLIKEPILWLQDPKYMMTVVIIVQLWVSFGTSFLTLRAGFSTIDKQYYEAAAVDGIKNRWQELWFVTLPIMSPHLMLSAILAITASFGAEAVATALTGFPSTNYATHTIMAHLRDFGMIRYERGYACAIATILFIFCIASNKFAQMLIRKAGT